MRIQPVALLLAATALAAAPSPASAQAASGAAPGAVGGSVGGRGNRALDVARLGDTVSAILARAVRDTAFPGAIAVVGTRDGVILQRAAGQLDWAPSPAPDSMTLWDLASLTKVVAATSAMMLLVESRDVELDAPVQRYLPEFTGTHKDLVTVRHLLTHSSGLPAWRPLYKEADGPAQAVALALATPLDTLPGVRMVYSDLGAIVLGLIVSRVSGQPFDRFVAERVFAPLGMTETRFLPPAELRERIAPTEVDPWRQRHLRGEVHDENAYALGGVSAHAGLFSTARDLARLARLYLNAGSLDGVRLISAETIALFTAVQDSTLSRRALGWETPSGSNSAGRFMSPRAFGHTGFTGTSLWIDPDNDVFVLLLSNRVNPTREQRRISEVRVALADAVLGLTGAAAPGR